MLDSAPTHLLRHGNDGLIKGPIERDDFNAGALATIPILGQTARDGNHENQTGSHHCSIPTKIRRYDSVRLVKLLKIQ